MADNGAVKGIRIPNGDSSFPCEGCILGKAQRTPIPKFTTSRANKPLQLVHSDVLGPIEVPSLGRVRYFVSFIDDFSKWTTVYTMSHKSKALDCFKDYKASAEKHKKTNLQTLHIHELHGSVLVQADDSLLLEALSSENGGEYLSTEFKYFLSKQGIQHRLTVAYTP